MPRTKPKLDYIPYGLEIWLEQSTDKGVRDLLDSLREISFRKEDKVHEIDQERDRIAQDNATIDTSTYYSQRMKAQYVPLLQEYTEKRDQALCLYIDALKNDPSRIRNDARISSTEDTVDFITVSSIERLQAMDCLVRTHPEANYTTRWWTGNALTHRSDPYIEAYQKDYLLYDVETELYAVLNGLAVYLYLYDLASLDTAELETVAKESLYKLLVEFAPEEAKILHTTDFPLKAYYLYTRGELSTEYRYKTQTGKHEDYVQLSLEGFEQDNTIEKVQYEAPVSNSTSYALIRTAYERYLSSLRPSVRLSVFELASSMYPTGAGTRAVTRAVTIDTRKGVTSKDYEIDGLKIRHTQTTAGTGKNALLALKLFMIVCNQYTRQNPNKGNPSSADVYIPYTEFEALCYGTDPVTERTKKERRKRVRDALEALKKNQFSFRGSAGGYAVAFPVAVLIPKTDVIHVRVLDEYGKILLADPKTYYPKTIYAIDNDDIKSFLLAQYMCDNYYRDNRQAHGENNRLQIKFIVEKSECFPAWKNIETKYRKRDIAGVIFNCLEKLTKKYHVLSEDPSYSFMLRNSDGSFTEDVNVYDMDYTDLLKVYVRFELAEPQDTSERVQRFLEKEKERQRESTPSKKKRQGKRKA